MTILIPQNHPIYVAFDGAGDPGQGEAGGDGVEVLAEGPGEALQGFRGVLFGLADPLHQQESALVADEFGEGAGQVAGAGDVWAGEPDLEQSFLLAVGEGVAWAHDPGGDLARAGDVGPARCGGACPEGGEVLADDLATAEVAAFVDFVEETGAADLALCLGEASVEVCLERFQHAVGPAVAGGGQQLVEVGVAEAAHGLAVEVQPPGDGADRPALLHQAVLPCSWVGRAVVRSRDPETPGMASKRLPSMVPSTWPPGVSRRLGR